MQQYFKWLLLLTVALPFSLDDHRPASAAADLSYKVRDLLDPCVEGDNDSRGGTILELECEQYVSGFVDLYLKAGMDVRHGVCLPNTRNLSDEIRWAFMRWAHENYDQLLIPAVDGLIATLIDRFPCLK